MLPSDQTAQLSRLIRRYTDHILQDNRVKAKNPYPSPILSARAFFKRPTLNMLSSVGLRQGSIPRSAGPSPLTNVTMLPCLSYILGVVSFRWRIRDLSNTSGCLDFPYSSYSEYKIASLTINSMYTHLYITIWNHNRAQSCRCKSKLT